MCGIVAVAAIGKTILPIGTNDLEAMNNLIRHRGPDDGGIRFSGWYGLANRRLSVIDLHSGHQPLRTYL